MRTRDTAALVIVVIAVVLAAAVRFGGSVGGSGEGLETPAASVAGAGETRSPAGSVPSVGPTSGATPGAASAPPAGSIPEFAHVFVVVMENKEAGAIIGSPQAPYINGLARRYGLATDYRAVAHPSEPNYLALWSGSTQGVGNDGIHDFGSGATLADQLEAAGRSWHVAAENVPPGCYTGATASGGADGVGTYARKHEPAISWTSVSGDPQRCARITDLSHFNPDLGNLWFIAPNLCHDMHDCSIATGDAFLKAWLPRILDSPAFADGVVFLTWDEGTTSAGGGGRVATIVISPLAKAGLTSAVPHTHYSLLRTIEEGFGLPCLAHACDANDLREFFR
jgi:hypothetical protein